jgi:hypothetical protein
MVEAAEGRDLAAPKEIEDLVDRFENRREGKGCHMSLPKE